MNGNLKEFNAIRSGNPTSTLPHIVVVQMLGRNQSLPYHPGGFPTGLSVSRTTPQNASWVGNHQRRTRGTRGTLVDTNDTMPSVADIPPPGCPTSSVASPRFNDAYPRKIGFTSCTNALRSRGKRRALRGSGESARGRAVLSFRAKPGGRMPLSHHG